MTFKVGDIVRLVKDWGGSGREYFGDCGTIIKSYHESEQHFWVVKMYGNGLNYYFFEESLEKTTVGEVKLQMLLK